ncbi:MAG TPA: elongation factor P maturation arginine rhamnosyltransferase EarP, partial [Usitatibacter sp.]|nr:elongation factor P maturation arginine rhamnosyltransferase EarP [Usitatibacter sp.]
RASQPLEGVEVTRLREGFSPGDVADVVVETFGCDPPESYVNAMANRQPRARWINLEYLSAEEWVERSHALPSPNPRLPLTKHYFFPGFTARTGGLLRESDLLDRRDTFQRDRGAQAAFWRSLTGAVPPAGALKLSLFSYAGAPVSSLLRSCVRSAGPVWIVAPEGAAAAALEEWRRSHHLESGALELFAVPFLAQDRYDELLWACDVNFVRGEDSFVRAQWAGRPFVWQIYPRDDGAHWVKLAAFLALYTADLDRAHARAVTELWEAWNHRDEPSAGEPARTALASAWPGFSARREALEGHARAWSRRLSRQREQSAQLVDFADNVLK